MDNRVVICNLGRSAYTATWELQRAIQSKIIASKRSGTEIPHVILTVEHPPVFTLGKSGDEQNLLANADDLFEIGASFVKIDRGGDITYHGPGQLVVYPILDLDRIFTDIGKYLRFLEEAVIQTCSEWGIKADRVKGRTGVWVEADERGPERKICALGIKCSRWVTMHGLALNIATNLSHFESIIPCGISDRGVTSMQVETGGAVDEDEVRRVLIEQLTVQFSLSRTELSTAESEEYLHTEFDISLTEIEALRSF